MRLGHVHLKVRNLDRSIEFYCDVFGLSVTQRIGGYAFLSDGSDHHTVALQALGDLAPESLANGVGLYHAAFEVKSEEELKRAFQKVKTMGEVVAVDHGISWAIYFDDPDGNGLEIYVDRRQAQGGAESWNGISRRLDLDENGA